MKLTHSMRLKASAAIAISLVALCAGVFAGTGLTGAAPARKAKAPKACITAIHDYQLIRTDILKMLKEEGDGYSQLVVTAFKAGLADTHALATDVLAKEKRIVATTKSEAPALTSLEQRAVAAADKCEKG